LSVVREKDLRQAADMPLYWWQPSVSIHVCSAG
jgi:hypothetical protein